MMKKALVEVRSEPQFATGFRIAQVVDGESEFEVAPPLEWIDCPDEVTEHWQYDGEQFLPPPQPPAPPSQRDQIAARVDQDPLIRALLQREARQKGVDVQQVLDELGVELD